MVDFTTLHPFDFDINLLFVSFFSEVQFNMASSPGVPYKTSLNEKIAYTIWGRFSALWH